MRAVALVVVCALACRYGEPRAPLARAGAIGSASGDVYADEGAGELARASTRLMIDGDAAAKFGADRRGRYGGDAYGGDPYGGTMYGGDPYGGVSYASWVPPQPTYSPPVHPMRYTPLAGLTGAIEGVVTWAGPPPAKVATMCGVIDNPTLRVGDAKTLRGALVYIERVRVGRVPPALPRPAMIGGILVKHGCVFAPAAQLVTATTLSIHGDATRTRVRAGGKAYELQEGGLVEVEVTPGVMKVDSEDGRIGAAWIVSVESPYYAVTDDAGRYRIDELAPGTYDVTFFQPPAATVGAGGVLGYGEPIVVHRSVEVDAAKTSRLGVALR